MATVQTWNSPGYFEYTVPAGATQLYLECWGADGNDGVLKGGNGGISKGYLDVLPGQKLYLFVGSRNANSGDDWPQGANFPGWELHGTTWGGGGYQQTASGGAGTRAGGGASFICRDSPNRAGIILLAGGGGGAGSDPLDSSWGTFGGHGGGASGTVSDGWYSGMAPAQPGSQASGGAGAEDTDGGGSPRNGYDGDSHGMGCGGRTAGGNARSCGGGGGGWHGGGAGGTNYDDGDSRAVHAAGGSGYVSGAITSPINVAGGSLTTYPKPNGATARQGAIRITVSNRAPYAPVVSSPPNASSWAPTDNVFFEWAFGDPDAGDTQSAAEIRWRPVGGTTWTTISMTTEQSVSVPGTTFGTDNIEFQIRTKDAAGLWGPYSATQTFTVTAGATVAPTITSPANGSFINDTTANVNWSVPDQDAYQVRQLGDNAGAPNTGNILYDSGTVEQPATRSHALTFPVNGRVEHIQVRARVGGVWSTWTSVRVTVNYDSPPTPTYAAVVDSNLEVIDITITNPAPGSGEVATGYNDIFIDDGDGKGWVRKATGLPVNGTWRYWTPRTRWDYNGHIRVVAVGLNGATAQS